MKIVFLDESTVTLNDIDFSCFKSLGDYRAYPNSEGKEVLQRAANADVVIVNKVPMRREIMSQLPQLKLIAVIATGFNNVDTEAARERQITVCNVAGYAANSVPQHVFALILNLATRTHMYDADVKMGKWQSSESFTLLTYPTFELAGKTIGIIGFGAIGRGVARIARGFGMKVVVYDVADAAEGEYRRTDLDTVLGESDVVTLHCPLTERTRGLVDAAAIAKMKHGALLINTARGGIVDEQALADALNSGHIAGAGIDVLVEEPPRSGNVLIDAKNVLITPHSAWSAVEARQRLVDETAENIKAFAEGRARNVVN